MGLFSKIFGKKSTSLSVPIEYREIINFETKLSQILDLDVYIARSDYAELIKQYKDTYVYFENINRGNILDYYCKKNRLDNQRVLQFLQSFLDIEDLKNSSSIIAQHNKNYVEKHLLEDKKYLDSILNLVDKNISLDNDQRKVILTDEDYCLVIAGAGAGKTTTVAAKVKYLVEKKNIDPKQILIISFTNKAVGELKDKINNALQIDCPITTFHSAGNAILRKTQDEKLNIVESGFLYNTVRNFFMNKMKSKKTADNIVLFFGSYFDYQFEGQNFQEYLNSIIRSDFTTIKSNLNEYEYSYTEKKTNKKITLNHEIVNSAQEVQIANFLYINSIEYEYEPKYPYYIYMAKKRYTPDFLIKQNGKCYYLEHFGISENGENDRYNSEELARYKKSIGDKISIHKNHNTNLIYTYSKYNDGRSLLKHLSQLLTDNGIEMNQRSSEEILQKLANIQENKYISKMVYLICDFINNFKVNGYTEGKFYEFIRTTKSERTKVFLEICRECYLEYQKALVENNAVDFQDMINDAASALRNIKSLKQKLDFKYIIVDEYQDISRQRFDMAQELSKVTDAKIVAVGDDWQSIFAFSGSDVTLFTQFCKKMGYGEELKITKTYRNAQEVIDIAGGFIQKNDAQIKKSLISPKHIKDPVIIVSYDDSPKRRDETAKEGGPLNKMARALEYAIGKIVESFGENSAILLIGRYGYDGEQLARTSLFKYVEYGNKVICNKYPKTRIDFLTAHSSKGLGYDNVIIINAKNAVYGFPSKIEDDPVMKLVIKQHDEIEYAEERRLFYVALTRTKNRVYLIAPEQHPSQFVMEIKKDYENVVLKGELNPEEKGLLTNKICPICGYPLQRRHSKTCGMSLWICTNEPEVCGFLSNNLLGGSMSIQKCNECSDGYLIIKTKEGHPFLGCTNYKIDGFGCNNTISPQEYEFSNNDDDIIDYSNNASKNNSKNNSENNEEIQIDEPVKVNNQRCDKETNIQDFYDKKVLLGKEKVSKYGNAIIDIIKTYKIDDANNDTDTDSESVGSLENSNCVEETSSFSSCDEKSNTIGTDVCATIVDAYKSMSKIKHYGVTMFAHYLRGKKPKSLLDEQLDKQPLYGSLKSLSNDVVVSLIEYLVDENVLYKTAGVYPTLRINYNAEQVKIDEQIVNEILEQCEDNYTIKSGNFDLIADENGEIKTDLELLKDLRILRNSISVQKDVPPYCICSNKVLVLLSTYKPKSREEFLQLKGIGDKWYNNYAHLFLEPINNSSK